MATRPVLHGGPEGIDIDRMPHIDLLELPYFEHIALGDVVSLIDAMAPRQYHAGEPVLHAEHVCEQLVIATAGQVRLLGAAAPPLAAPVALGVNAFFARTHAPIGAVAVGELSVFCLTHERFDALLAERHPALPLFLRNLLACQAGLQPRRCVG